MMIGNFMTYPLDSARILAETDTLFYGKTGLDQGRVAGIVSDALVGMDDGELYLESGLSENFVWDDGKLRKAGYNTHQGFGLRAIIGDTIGYAHSNTLEESALRRAVESARAVGAGHGGTLALPPKPVDHRLYGDANPLLSRTFEDKIQLLQKIDAYIRAKDPSVAQVSISLAASWKAVQIVGRDGWRVADIRPLVSLHLQTVVRRGDRLEEGFSGGGGRLDYDVVFEEARWKKIADESLRKALVALESVEAPAGEMTVVVGPGWPAVLLHEAVGHGLEGDFNRKKSSAFAGLMGERVAAPGVTVVDDGTIAERRGSLNIDDEGTPTQRNVLIEDGILVGYMQDRLNARLMGTVSTGNGRRENYACQPYPRMTNTLMPSGHHTHDEIIASVKKGIYAADFGGGQVDTTSGKFVFSATEAYEIEDGKLGRPLKGTSLVGTGFETLKHISMIGDNCQLDGGIGTCGKHGQSVPTGVGQPTLRIENMTVGGAAV